MKTTQLLILFRDQISENFLLFISNIMKGMRTTEKNFTLDFQALWQNLRVDYSNYSKIILFCGVKLSNNHKINC